MQAQKLACMQIPKQVTLAIAICHSLHLMQLMPLHVEMIFFSKMIIIEGAPGIGKTTLCKEIAYQWATKQILTSTKLLLFIRLHFVIY